MREDKISLSEDEIVVERDLVARPNQVGVNGVASPSRAVGEENSNDTDNNDGDGWDSNTLMIVIH